MPTLPTTTPHDAFVTARDRAREAARRAGARATRLGVVRLVSFFALDALVAWIGIELHPAAGIAAAVAGVVAFNQLVGRQQAADRERDRQQRIAALNEGELASLDYDFARFDGGGDYRDAQHPYTADLDVFGPNSVFALLNRTASLVGREGLAAYCRHPLADPDDIAARQRAAAELGADLEWRQRFLAAGAEAPGRARALDRLRHWAAAPQQLTAAWWPAVFWGLGLFNVAWLASFFFLPFYLALLAYAPTLYLLYRARPVVDEVHAQTEEAVDLLAQYREMIAAVEGRAWSSELCLVLAEALTVEGGRLSSALDELAGDARQLAVRVNPFVLLLNLVSFWEVRYARRLERWKARYLQAGARASDLPASVAFALPTELSDASVAPRPTRLDDWLVALGALDALTSLGGASFRYPAWAWPEVVAGTGIAGRGLHHPLLPPGRSVPNDFAAPAQSHIHLLTGSNMAGKSTFLRTIGLHLAMAQWGAPVPAAALRLPPLSVYTSMRTQDDLHRGASAFYAELQRLRVVVDATRARERVFFLLDEILKGTNSQDRHAGGRALIEQLIRHGGAGIIATHDLELGAMATESSAIDNLRLEVEADDEGELYFDYTVKPGLAQSRNASILMARLGLGESPS